MDKIYRWTVDVEYDWGGRTDGIEGIKTGLPRIAELFLKQSIIGLFFISTETSKHYPRLAEKLRNCGHEVGSHGHVHAKYKESFRRQADKDLSLSLLGDQKAHFRAPKFYWETDDIYSQKKNHVSLLKNKWLKENIKDNTIIYLHPFDIVETSELAPNLFCKLWYSRPKRAYETFINLLNRYSKSYID